MITFPGHELARNDKLLLSLTLTREILLKAVEMTQTKKDDLNELLFTALDRVIDPNDELKGEFWRTTSNGSMLTRKADGNHSVSGPGQRTVIYQAKTTEVAEAIATNLGGPSGTAKITLNGTEFRIPFGVGAARDSHGSFRKGPVQKGEAGMMFFEHTLDALGDFIFLQKDLAKVGLSLRGTNLTAGGSTATQQFKIVISRAALENAAFNYEKSHVPGTSTLVFKQRRADSMMPRYCLYKTADGTVRNFVKIIIFSEQHAAVKRQKALQRRQHSGEAAPVQVPAAAEPVARTAAAVPPAPNATEISGAQQQLGALAHVRHGCDEGSRRTTHRSDQRVRAAAKVVQKAARHSDAVVRGRPQASTGAVPRTASASAGSRTAAAKKGAPPAAKATGGRTVPGDTALAAGRSPAGKPPRAAAAPNAPLNLPNGAVVGAAPAPAAAPRDAAAPKEWVLVANGSSGQTARPAAAPKADSNSYSTLARLDRALEDADEAASAMICASQSQHAGHADTSEDWRRGSEDRDERVDRGKRSHPDSGGSSPESGPIKAARSSNPQDLELSSCDPMEHGEDSSHNQAPEGDAVAPCHNLSS